MIYTPENTAMIGVPCRVFLNGRELHDVCLADTSSGKVVVVRRNRKGIVSINYKDGIVRRKVLRGVVAVEELTKC